VGGGGEKGHEYSLQGRKPGMKENYKPNFMQTSLDKERGKGKNTQINKTGGGRK